ncbi:MAG: hypothetical protein HQK99_09950 [Nitrospirae bacterium]|nr:hypothetical protein [Nitrospirota bacterium]
MRQRCSLSRGTLLYFAYIVVYLASVWSYYDELFVKNDHVMRSIFFIIYPVLLAFKLEVLVNSNSLKEETRQLHENILNTVKEISTMLQRTDQIFTFPNAGVGFKYCTDTCLLSSEVKNTMFRYNTKLQATYYEKWLEAKEQVISNNECIWTDIASSHIPDDDHVKQRINRFTSDMKTRYNIRYLDDTVLPFIQMTIFKFTDRQNEVVFGWSFHRDKIGACFKTNNQLVVKYFEGYFDYLFYDIADAEPQSKVQSIDMKSMPDPIVPSDCG